MEGVDEEVSNEVDKHIVEMEFKNAEFEKNAAKTLQTLQELKQKLNDNFSTKGAEELNAAIKSVDVSPISKGLDAVQVQFSALQVAGKRIIENIVDAAMGAISKVTSKLTGVINQIKVGGANRAQNIAQAKFMLEGLGIEWAKIEGDISYGVQDTAYGLDAAAKVASQLVASNISLGDDMRMALRGISGVAAMSNSTYEEIGHIFTAIAGQGRVMSIQLNQLATRGLNVAAVLAQAMHTTEAEIKDMVSKGKIDFMTFAKAMDDAYGEHAKEANKTFTGALSNTKAALSRLGADIQTQKFESFRIILLEVTTQLKELKKAFKPAEEAIISMMEAVGKLVANFIKAIDIKGIVDRITPSIQKIANYVRDFANAWRLIRETQSKMDSIKFTSIADYYQQRAEALKETTEEVVTSVDKLAALSDEELKKYKDNAWDIWNIGKYGNGQARIDALGKDYELTQAYVEKMIELGWDDAKMEEYLAEQRKKAAEAEKKADRANRLKMTVSKVLTIFTNIKRVFSNVAVSIKNILSAMFSGLGEAMAGKGKGFLDGMIYVTDKVADFTDKIVITKDRANKLKPVFKAIGDAVIFIAKALGTAVKYLVRFISAVAQNKIVKSIFEAIGKAINKIFEGLKKLYTKLEESGVWGKFIDILKTVGTWLGERLIDGINLLGNVASRIGEVLVSIFGKVTDKLSDMRDKTKDGHGWLSKIGDFFKEDILSGSWLVKLKDLLTDIFGTGKDVFQTAFKKGSDFITGLAKGIRSLDREDVDLILRTISKIGLTLSTIKWLWSMTAFNKKVTGTFDSLNKLFEAIGFTVTKYGKLATAQRFESFAKSIAIIVGSFAALILLFAYLEGIGRDAHGMFIKVGNILGMIIGLVGGLFIAALAVERKVIATGRSVSVFGNVRVPAIAAIIIGLGYFLKTVIESVMTLYDLVTSNKYSGKAMLIVSIFIGALLGAVMGIAGAMSKLDKEIIGMTGVAFTMIAIGILVRSVVNSFKKILKAIRGVDKDTISAATSTINWLVWPILIFAGAIVFITRKIPTTSAIQTNPFKGIMGMFIGLAALLRLGFMPLLKTLADLRKEGDAGIAAISDFKNIVKWIMIFVGLLTTVLAVLDRDFIKNPRNIGSAAAGSNKLTGGFTTSSKSGMLWGVAAIVAGLAAMMYTISIVMKNMKGVSPDNIKSFKNMIESILVIVSLLAVVAGIIGFADQTKGLPLALLALAAVIAAVGVVMAASAYSFKTFTEAVREMIEYLPDAVRKIIEFFKLIEENRDEIVTGVYNTTRLFLDSVTAAIVGWSEGIKENVPTIVSNLFAALIVSLNALADEFNKNGPELVDAADRASIGFLKFLALVMQKVQEHGQDFIKNIGVAIGGLMVKGMNPVTKHILGLDDLVEDDELLTPAYWEKQQELYQKELEKAQANVPSWYDQMEANGKKWSEDTYGSKAIASSFIPDSDKLSEQFDNLIGGAIDKIDAKAIKSRLVSKLSSEQLGLGDLKSMFSTGDISGLSQNLGLNLSMDEYTEAFSNFDFTTEQGLNDAMDYFSQFQNESSSGWSSWADDFSDYGEDSMSELEAGIKERMTFVTDITGEAMEASVKEASKFESDFYTIGENSAKGFANGLTSTSSLINVMKASKYLAETATKSIKARDALDQRSPSHVFEKIGLFTVLGFVNGIRDNVAYVSEATQEVGEATILSMRETIRQASFDAVNGIDSPRITPVLDLSSIMEGADTIDGLFEGSPAYNLAMAASRDAKLANGRKTSAIYQNGSKFDDSNTINAINNLNGQVSTLKDAIEGMQVVIDGRALVGQIATPMDKALGRKALSERRGV